MITFIRSLFQSRIGAFIAIAFVGLIGIAFALADVGGSGSFGGVGGATAAEVGSEDIGSGELTEAVDNAFRQSQRENPGTDLASFVRGGGFEATLDRLVNGYVIAAFGDKYGMAVSDRMIDAEIRDIPAFSGVSGSFDEATFREALRRNGVSEATFRDDLRRSLFLEQLLTPAGFAAKASESAVLPYAGLILEKRKGQVGFVPAELYFPDKAPTDKQLAQFYREQAAEFTIPERRSIRYAQFDRSVVAKRVKVTDAEIAKYYTDNRATYAASETRTLSQLIVPTEAAARSVADRVKGGASLAAVANDIGVSVSTIDEVTRAVYGGQSSAAVAKAAFSTAAGGVTPPLRGNLGWYLVKIDSVQPLPARSLAEVRGDIRAALLNQRVEEQLAELTSDIEDRLAGGEALTEVAKSLGIDVSRTPLLLPDGRNPDDPNYKAPEETAQIRQLGFQLDIDGEPQLVELAEGTQYAIIGVAESKPAAPPPLARVRETVTTAWQLAQGSQAAEKIAKRIVAATDKKDTAFAKAFAAQDKPLPKPETLAGSRRELTQNRQQIPPPLQLMFSMTEGSTKMIAAPGDQGWFIIHLDEIERGDARKEPELLAATRSQFGQALGQEYSEQFINAMRADVGVSRNESEIARLRAQMAGDGAN